MALPRSISSQLSAIHIGDEITGLSALEKLPAELSRKIYEDLLKAENVRQAPDEDMVCQYRFETAILRVSKRIYRETWPVLYRENHFLTVSCNYDNIFTDCARNEVAVIAASKPPLVARFKESIARFHFQFPEPPRGRLQSNKSKNRATHSFLLVAIELPRFMRWLRMLKLSAGSVRLKLIFRVEDRAGVTPSLAAQKRVLEPFKDLMGNMSVWVGGSIDPALGKALKEKMGCEIHWARGVAWDIYDMLLSLKRMGDQAWGLKRWNQACRKWLMCQNMFQTVATGYLLTFGFEDYPFNQALEHNSLTLEASMALAMIYEKMWPELLDRTDNLAFFTSNLSRGYTSAAFKISFMSRMHHYRAIGLAATHMCPSKIDGDERAMVELVKAGKHDPSNEVIQDHIMITKKRLRVKDPAKRDAVGTIFSDDLLSRLGEPLQAPPSEMPPSDSIAGERYLLRQLGYQGNYLPAIEEKAPVNMNELGSILMDIEKHKAQFAPGTPLKVWVSGAGKPRVSFAPPRR